jgi:hypothetical protein
VQKSIVQHIEKIEVNVDSHAVLVDFLYAVYVLLKADPTIKQTMIFENRAFEAVLNVNLFFHNFICYLIDLNRL